MLRLSEVVPGDEHLEDSIQVLIKRAKLFFIEMHLDYYMLSACHPQNVEKETFEDPHALFC